MGGRGEQLQKEGEEGEGYPRRKGTQEEGRGQAGGGTGRVQEEGKVGRARHCKRKAQGKGNGKAGEVEVNERWNLLCRQAQEEK